MRGRYSTNDPLMEFEFHLEPDEPPISGLAVHGGGTLWVRTCYAADDLPEGVFERYDVFDPEGRFLEEVLLAPPVDPEEDALHWVGADAIVRFTSVGSTSAMQSRAMGFKTGADGQAGADIQAGDGDSSGSEKAPLLELILYRRQR